ncbi:MAG: insulinase family protein, partial [Planctomycetota bacterium]
IPELRIPKSGGSRVYGETPGTASLRVAYRLPPGGKPTEVACELLAMHLGDPEGTLRNRLVKEKGIATGLNVHYDARKYAGIFWIMVEMKPGHSPEEAETDVLTAVQALIDSPISEKEVAILARRYRAEILGAFKDDMRMGFLLLRREILGSWRDFPVLIERARRTTPEDLRKIAADYLVQSNRIVGILETKKKSTRTAPPTVPTEPRSVPKKRESLPASWKDLTFKEKSLEIPNARDCLATLSNGIRVVAVSDPYDPVIRIEALLAGGSSQDPEGKEGLCGLLASVARKSGLPGMSWKAIREKLEDLVGDRSISADFESLNFSLRIFKEDQEEALKLFKALLLYIRLDETKLKEIKERKKSDLIDMDARPRTVCSLKYSELLWGKNKKTKRTTPASIDAITMADLEKALAEHRDPRRCILAVSGDFKKEEMVERLERMFGDWAPGEGPLPDLSPGKASPHAKGLHVMDFEVSQGYVMIGAPTVPQGAEKYPVLRMLSGILSRRIFNRIRSNEGLAYQASAYLNADWDFPSPLTIIFQTKAKSVPFGISLALDEVQKIASDGPTEKEMTRVKRQVSTSLQFALGRGSERAQAFARLLLNPSASLDWYPTYWRFARGVSADDIRRAASKYLQREDLTILCVGKRSGMEAGDGEHANRLADFGPVKTLEPPAPQAEPKTPREVVLYLIRRIAAADVEGMKPYVAEAYRKRLEDPNTVAQIKMQGRMLGQAKYEVLGTREEGDKAEVTVSFEMKMGEQAMKITMAFQLQRLEGKWVCTEFRPVR